MTAHRNRKAEKAKYYQLNRERILARQKEYKNKNRETILLVRKVSENLGVSWTEARGMLA